MASPGSVVIQFLTRTEEAVRDLTRFGREMDKVETAADSVDTSLRNAQTAFDKTGTEADQAANEVRAAARRMADSVDTATTGMDASLDSVDDSTRGMATNMGEAGSEAGSELVANIAEGIGSGQANLNDVIQGTLGGLTMLVSGMAGPIGIAAGVAAAGVGLAFQAVSREQEKAQEAVDSITGALVTMGETSSEAAKEAIWDAWVAGLDEGGEEIAGITDGLKAAGVPAGVFKDAMTGSEEAAAQVHAAIERQLGPVEEMSGAQLEQLDNYKAIYTALGITEDGLNSANTQLDNLAYLTGESADNTDDWANKQGQVKREAEGTAAAIDGIPSNKNVNVNVNYKGKPPPGATHGGGAWSIGGGPAAATTAQAPVTMNVYAQGGGLPTTPRALIELLETSAVRVGRKPGVPRVPAW